MSEGHLKGRKKDRRLLSLCIITAWPNEVQLKVIKVFSFQMEIEAKQKALRTSKRSVQGPYIQYRSLTMPLKQVPGSICHYIERSFLIWVYKCYFKI